ncbi:MAG: hypothetical protein DIU77_018445 [Thermocrispum agreste]|uniref:Uncharacterized protein n=1 Tax=Thermocrispum agreste TaxID=37925 RepID=A0ABD6FJK8_9PSEU
MGLCGARGQLARTDLEHDDRFTGFCSTGRGGQEQAGLADRLGKHADGFGAGVVDEEVQDVGDSDHRLVAGGDDEAEPHVVTRRVADHRRPDRAALRHQGERAGLDRQVEAETARGDPVVQVRESEVVGAEQGDSEPLGDGDELLLPPASLRAFLGPALAEHDGRAGTRFGRVLQRRDGGLLPS